MKQRLQFAARLLLLLLFVGVGVPKLIAQQDFALVIFRYHLLPDDLINLAAILLPWVEIMGAAALLWPAWRPAGALVLSVMLLIATAAIAISLERGLDIDCGCFTLKPGASHIGVWNLVRNLTLLALTFWAGRSKSTHVCENIDQH
jgi:uncharacterized membrane protein YphA (DoxX/SURF4 family)